MSQSAQSEPNAFASGPEHDAEAVKRGEYLVQVGDCIACHTNVEDGGEAFAGGLPMDTPFGTFYTPNITPDDRIILDMSLICRGPWRAPDLASTAPS